ncbi:Ig-like domain-containing protein [Cystobacter fuscus]
MNAWSRVVLLFVGLGSVPVLAEKPDWVGLGSGRERSSAVSKVGQFVNRYTQESTNSNHQGALPGLRAACPNPEPSSESMHENEPDATCLDEVFKISSPLRGAFLNANAGFTVSGKSASRREVHVFIDGVRVGSSASVNHEWKVDVDSSSRFVDGDCYEMYAEIYPLLATCRTNTVWFIADLQSPDVDILSDDSSPPPNRTNDRTASFRLKSSASDLVDFQCVWLDAGVVLNEDDFSTCDAPLHPNEGGASNGFHAFVRKTQLKDGDYTLHVRAVDYAGNNEKIKSHKWTLDTVAPSVEFKNPPSSKGVPPPADNVNWINSKTPYFLGQVDEVGHAKYVCLYVDGVEVGWTEPDRFGQWFFAMSSAAQPSPNGEKSPCTDNSPKVMPDGLDDGAHDVSAIAMDDLGNLGLVAKAEKVKFVVDTEPPDVLIQEKPPLVDWLNEPVFVFASTSGGAKFECKIDDDPVSSCFERHVVSEELDNGEHTLLVWARDQAGNVSPSPAKWTWTVEFARPNPPQIIEPANGSTVHTGLPTISGRAEPGVEYVVVLIDGNQSGEPVPVGPGGEWVFQPPAQLGEGQHRLSARAKDVHGRLSASLAEEVYFMVDDGVSRAIGGGLGCYASSPLGSLMSVLSVLVLIFLRRGCRS